MNLLRRAPRKEALTDEQLVEELQRHMDADRFGLLYDRYGTKVYQKCLSMVRDPDLAKDLTHDIFLKTFVGLSKFDHRSKFGTWLYRITYNFCLDHLRKQQRKREDPLEEEGSMDLPEDDPNEARMLAIRAERLLEVLERLDPEDKALLLMKYQDDLPVAEIQEVLGVGPSAVKMRLLRARARCMDMYHTLYSARS